jgi:hypothetical protein
VLFHRIPLSVGSRIIVSDQSISSHYLKQGVVLERTDDRYLVDLEDGSRVRIPRSRISRAVVVLLNSQDIYEEVTVLSYSEDTQEYTVLRKNRILANVKIDQLFLPRSTLVRIIGREKNEYLDSNEYSVICENRDEVLVSPTNLRFFCCIWIYNDKHSQSSIKKKELLIRNHVGNYFHSQHPSKKF